MSPDEKAATLAPAILELIDDASKFFNKQLDLNQISRASDAQNREIARLVPARFEALIREWATGEHIDDPELQRRARAIFIEIACTVMGLQPLTAAPGSPS